MLKMHAGYLSDVYRLDYLICHAKRMLANVEYDTMVGTGLSGALVVPRMAEAMGKEWLIVRKGTDHAHTSKPAEGTLGERWIFVDDLIDTGATERRVRRAIGAMVRRSYYRVSTRYVGAYEYSPMYGYADYPEWTPRRGHLIKSQSLKNFEAGEHEPPRFSKDDMLVPVPFDVAVNGVLLGGSLRDIAGV